MGDPLASGVHADEVRGEGCHHLAGHNSRPFEEAGILLMAQFMPPGNMPLGYDQGVAFAKRIDIQDA